MSLFGFIKQSVRGEFLIQRSGVGIVEATPLNGQGLLTSSAS